MLKKQVDFWEAETLQNSSKVERQLKNSEILSQTGKAGLESKPL